MDGAALERPMVAASVVAVSFMVIGCLFVYTVCLLCCACFLMGRVEEVKIANCYV